MLSCWISMHLQPRWCFIRITDCWAEEHAQRIHTRLHSDSIPYSKLRARHRRDRRREWQLCPLSEMKLPIKQNYNTGPTLVNWRRMNHDLQIPSASAKQSSPLGLGGYMYSLSSTAEFHHFHYFHLQLSPFYHCSREELNLGHLWLGSPVTLLSSSSDLPKVLAISNSKPQSRL